MQGGHLSRGFLTRVIQNVQSAGVACATGDKALVSESRPVVEESLHAVLQDEALALLQCNGTAVNITAFGGCIGT